MLRAQKVINHLTRANLYSFAASNSKRSYYDILELQPNFTQKELRKSYLAKGKDSVNQPGSIIRIITSRKRQWRSSNC